ncbi:MAG: efflux RND transporter periplasmic adaptor subunit [Aeoliella sp.]
MKRTHRWILGCSVALLSCGCEQASEKTPVVVRPIKIHTIGSLEPAALREYPGAIRARQNAEMGFEVPGRVTEFLVREGDRVEEDQVLARLDPRDYQAQFKVAEANLKKAEADYQRSVNISKQTPGAISVDQIESDERAVAVTKALLDVAAKAVGDAELRAPFAGVMARKLVEDFANVRAKEAVLILQDTSALEIQISVPERDLARRAKNESEEELREGLSARVIVSALPDQAFAAAVKEFATTADPDTRTFPVKFTFEAPDDVNILPGMTARVRVVVLPELAWSVPSTAAQADESGKPYVWIVEPNKMTVSRMPVELGQLIDERVLLTSGVEQGDMVATSGVLSLREGMQVRTYDK